MYLMTRLLTKVIWHGMSLKLIKNEMQGYSRLYVISDTDTIASLALGNWQKPH